MRNPNEEVKKRLSSTSSLNDTSIIFVMLFNDIILRWLNGIDHRFEIASIVFQTKKNTESLSQSLLIRNSQIKINNFKKLVSILNNDCEVATHSKPTHFIMIIYNCTSIICWMHLTTNHRWCLQLYYEAAHIFPILVSCILLMEKAISNLITHFATSIQWIGQVNNFQKDDDKCISVSCWYCPIFFPLRISREAGEILYLEFRVQQHR